MVLSPVQYNFKLVDFTSLFHDISNSVLKDVHRYGLDNSSKLTLNVKRLILHYMIFHVCEVLINKKQKLPFVFYYNANTLKSKLHDFYGGELINNIISKYVQKIKKLLPVRVYEGTIPFDNLKVYIETMNGEGIDVIMHIKMYLDTINTEGFTFSKIRLFVRKNNLTFLNKDYFNQLKIKQLLIN